MAEHETRGKVNYRKGQRVHVEYDGIVQSPALPRLCVVDKTGDRHFYYPDGVNITVLDPENWPPQVGDVWEADSLDWYVRQYGGSGAKVVIEPFNKDDHPGETYSDGNVLTGYKSLDDFKAFNPMLVRRRAMLRRR